MYVIVSHVHEMGGSVGGCWRVVAMTITHHLQSDNVLQ